MGSSCGSKNSPGHCAAASGDMLPGHRGACSVAESCPTLCDPWAARPLCPPLSPGACSNSCPLSQ